MRKWVSPAPVRPPLEGGGLRTCAFPPITASSTRARKRRGLYKPGLQLANIRRGH